MFFFSIYRSLIRNADFYNAHDYTHRRSIIVRLIAKLRSFLLKVAELAVVIELYASVALRLSLIKTRFFIDTLRMRQLQAQENLLERMSSLNDLFDSYRQKILQFFLNTSMMNDNPVMQILQCVEDAQDFFGIEKSHTFELGHIDFLIRLFPLAREQDISVPFERDFYITALLRSLPDCLTSSVLKLPLPILAHYRDHAVTQLASGFERDLYLLFCLTSRSETEFHQRSCVQNFGKFMNLMKEKHLENIAVCLRNKRLDVLALRIGEMIKSIDADFSRLPELPPRFTIDSITGLCQQHGLFFVTGRPIHLAQNRAVIRQGTERAGAI